MKFQNNPCNLRFSVRNNWKGQLEPLGGFCRFSEFQYGIRACLKTLETYRKRGKKTVHQIISTFAPPFENNTLNYENFVCSRLTSYFNTVLDERDLFLNLSTAYVSGTVLSTRLEYSVLVAAMCKMESDTNISVDYVLKVCRKFNVFNYCN